MSRAIVAVGLGFGDEGKGSVVDALTRRHHSTLTVRFNGGAQAAHNVVLPDATHHTFAQFGSGTLAGARTHLSRFMLVNPMTMLNEAAHLESLGIADPLSLVTIDREALVTTPMHMGLNRLRELALGEGRHGSCGMGIGETVDFANHHPGVAIHARDLLTPHILQRKLRYLAEYCNAVGVSLAVATGRPRPPGFHEAWDMLAASFEDMSRPMFALAERAQIVDRTWLLGAMAETTTIFEGAQGVLLDEKHGFAPHTTWSNCTFDNAKELLEDFCGEVIALGITRAFMTRHGAGPFPTEMPKWGPLVAHDHNVAGPWQGALRVGALDLPLLRYAIGVIDGIDELCVTNLDRWSLTDYGVAPVCTHHVVDDEVLGFRVKNEVASPYFPLDRVEPFYGLLPAGRHPDPVAEFIASELDARLHLTSTGPTFLDKHWKGT